MGKVRLYGSIDDARKVPMYTFREAATYLRVPPSTLRSWTVGQDYQTRGGTRRFLPPIPLDDEQRLLTFFDLVEAYVLASIRRDHNVPLPVVRESVNYVRDRLGVARPLLTEQFHTDGARLFVEKWGVLVEASAQGQVAMKNLLGQYLKRIVRDEDGIVAQLYPWQHSVNEARVIELDPRRARGRAVVAGTGVAVDVVISRYRAGDSVKRLAKDFKLEERKVVAVVDWDEKRAA